MPDKRIAPSTHLRQALHEFLTQGIEQEESPTSALLGLAARVVLQGALEAEQRDALGRERWQRIADSAAEQCGRSRPMAIEAVAPLCDAASRLAEADLALVPHEDERQRGLRDALADAGAAKSVAIAVGPEGGFAPDEVQSLTAAGGLCVSLGPRILRSETAALFAAAAVLYGLGDLGSGPA